MSSRPALYSCLLLDLLGKLFFGAVEVSRELLIRDFLRGGGSVKVLQKRITQQSIIVDATDNRWGRNDRYSVGKCSNSSWLVAVIIDL